jgi:dipeptidyl aminopeptidase/acylaminoacyl peptidase
LVALAQDREKILSAMQEVMGSVPPTKNAPPKVKIVEEVATPAYTRRKILFAVDADDWVPAYVLIPRKLTRRVPAVLCLHQTTRPGKAEPAGLAGNPDLYYASELAERGFVTFAPDYPRFGEYDIDVYARGYASATMKGIVNHMRAVDVLQAMPEVDARAIGVIGHSLGGHNSLFVAAFDPRIRAVVTSCGFTSFAKYKGGDLKGWSHEGYMPRIATMFGNSPARMPFDFKGVLAVIAPRPLFINAPVGDSNFDVSGVRDTLAAVRGMFGENLQVVYPDAGHAFPKPVREQAYAFLRKALTGRQ